MRSSTALIALGCAASLTILVGCTADAEPETTVTSPAPVPTTAPGPTTTPTTTPTPTATPSPTPVPVPTPPADMSRDDETGAIAAATYFISDLYEYAYATLDVDALTAISDPECNYCHNTIEAVNMMREAGESSSIGPMQVSEPTARLLEPGLYWVGMRLTTGPDNYFSPDGSPVEHRGVQSGTAVFNIVHTGDRWLVRGVSLTRDASGEGS